MSRRTTRSSQRKFGPLQERSTSKENTPPSYYAPQVQWKQDKENYPLQMGDLIRSGLREVQLNPTPQKDGKIKSDSPASRTSNVSPMLQMLINTPGRTKQTQRILMNKHQEAKSKAEERIIGGGISVWPEMDNMRLTTKEVWTLAVNSVALLFTTVGLFYYIHGSTLDSLQQYNTRLLRFTTSHPLDTTDQTIFTASILRWHQDYSYLLTSVDKSFEISKTSCPPTYPLVIFLYISGIITLLYYLYDLVFSRSRLTPRRIKTWVCLLVILSTWTVLMVYLLANAVTLERLFQENVLTLNEYLNKLLFTDLDLSKYESILGYWRTRCLPPSSPGVLSIMGVFSVQTFTYYLLYYCLPILTALCTPFIHLFIAVYEVYTAKLHPD